MTGLPPITHADDLGSKPAVVATEGEFTYRELATATRSVAAVLGDGADLEQSRVAVMVPPGFRHVATQWGTWAAGGVTVPLAMGNPAPELAYVLDDADVSIIVADAENRDVLAPLAAERDLPLLDADDVVSGSTPPTRLPDIGADRRCMILYTSGTTGRPKGVVWRHGNLDAQLRCLTEAWHWSPNDRALLVLPLHHVHGIVNVMSCALWNGATLEMHPRFDAAATWDRFASGELTVFMAVPTIYRRLIQHWDEAGAAERDAMRRGLAQMRLMVSGSAALPVPTLERWREISGHTLLERYGMTEIGMALSNPYDGTRRPGTVGAPLPTVEVRLVGDDGTPVDSGTQGEIEVRGPSVFDEYWGRPDATAEAFHDGWFRTGDEAVAHDGVYRILGRRSIDIIKSGGEKVSALEVEDVLRTHPAVDDCAVVGVADDEWGERVVAAVVAAADLDPADLQAFARARLAPYKVPRRVVIVADLPRNALGKVVKPEVRSLPAISAPDTIT